MSAQTQLCDTRDMVIVHRVFRREFGLLPAMVQSVAAGDTQRSALVAGHTAEMVTALHHHHSGEDDLLWPKLHRRAALSVDLVDRMEQQHEHIADVLESVQALLPGWSAGALLSSGRVLAERLGQVSTALNEHLAEEESELLPLAERHVTQDEWVELGKRGMAAIPKSRLLVFLGYILEETTSEEQARFLRKVPPPARAAYKLIGRRKYEKEKALLRRGISNVNQKGTS